MSETVHYLSITGMTCGCCSGRVTRALEATPGVLKAFISFEDNDGNILTTLKSTNLHWLKSSIQLVSKHPLEAFVSNPRGDAISLRGGRPAWSTAVGLGPIPYWFAGSNPAPRTILHRQY